MNGLSHLWTQGDLVSQFTALLLLLMSVLSWYLIITRTLRLLKLRKQAQEAQTRFWQAGNLQQGRQALAGLPALQTLVQSGENALSLSGSAMLDREATLTRGLRQGLSRAVNQLESGLSVLASIGSTAPFIGLFGTVWGIYHALARIGATGQASLDQIAGPVGEALIMTAAGLFVAIPAVLAYNALVRLLRNIQTELDGFAYDLLNGFATGRLGQGTPPASPAPASPLPVGTQPQTAQVSS